MKYLRQVSAMATLPGLSKAFRAIGICLAVAIAAIQADGGGPLKVAGVTGFDSGMAGVPVTWSGGTIHYYTDQGDLSPLLPQGSADAMVADAFSRWTSITTASISASRGGQLNEDVSGMNVSGGLGSVNLPSDIRPDATSLPVAIVYDADGKVTDALLGEGAGSSEMCSTNSVYGGPDNYTSDAHYSHALVIINGNCAKTPTGVSNVKYQLVRVLGRVLGLDWSDLNENVVTGSPPPTADDKAGFPLMHAMEPACWSPPCVPEGDQPKMDDRAALSRLYPPGQMGTRRQSGWQTQGVGAGTARIHGIVSFSKSDGSAGQPMQGAKVVARWVDPATGIASHAHQVASVSGFLFRGNAGNPITGYYASTGQRYDQSGSSDASLEGFYDLSGLEFPDSAATAQYEISIEPVDPMCAQTMAVGPYRDGQVMPSGSFQPVRVTLNQGDDIARDIVMAGSAVGIQDAASTFSHPVKLPPGGEWAGSLSGYGNADYFAMSGRENRTMTLEVTALDENGRSSQVKALPVIGIWAGSDPDGSAPQTSAYYFNTGIQGQTAINAQFLLTRDFKIGIADFRGDGRPDFSYYARMLYGDTVSPSRIGVQGGTPLTIQGIGFRNGITATIGEKRASVISISPNQVVVSAPALKDGANSIVIQDEDGATTRLIDSLTYGGTAGDKIVLLQGANSWTPVGAQTANPFRVQVLENDGITPVNGATVKLSSSPAGVQFTACGASKCSVVTDATGEAVSNMIMAAAGSTTISATLANGASVETTVAGSSSALDIGVLQPRRWLRKGTTAKLLLTARVLSNGAPLNGRTVNFDVTSGSGTLSAPSAKTDANGYASTNLNIRNLVDGLNASACVAPGNAPCQNFYIFAVKDSVLRLEAVGETEQIVNTAQSFRPVQFRLVDSSSPPEAVQMSTVLVSSSIYRWQPDAFIGGNMIWPRRPAKTLLSSWQGPVTSDSNGIATFTPSPAASLGAVVVELTVTAGAASLQTELNRVWAPGTDQSGESSQPGLSPGRKLPFTRPPVELRAIGHRPASWSRYPPTD